MTVLSTANHLYVLCAAGYVLINTIRTFIPNYAEQHDITYNLNILLLFLSLLFVLDSFLYVYNYFIQIAEQYTMSGWELIIQQQKENSNDEYYQQQYTFPSLQLPNNENSVDSPVQTQQHLTMNENQCIHRTSTGNVNNITIQHTVIEVQPITDKQLNDEYYKQSMLSPRRSPKLSPSSPSASPRKSFNSTNSHNSNSKYSLHNLTILIYHLLSTVEGIAELLNCIGSIGYFITSLTPFLIILFEDYEETLDFYSTYCDTVSMFLFLIDSFLYFYIWISASQYDGTKRYCNIQYTERYYWLGNILNVIAGLFYLFSVLYTFYWKWLTFSHETANSIHYQTDTETTTTSDLTQSQLQLQQHQLQLSHHHTILLLAWFGDCSYLLCSLCMEAAYYNDRKTHHNVKNNMSGNSLDTVNEYTERHRSTSKMSMRYEDNNLQNQHNHAQ